MMTQYKVSAHADIIANVMKEVLVAKTSLYKKSNVMEIPCSFDTEVSSFEDINGYVGLLYIWMFGINDYVIYGRELEDFVDFINEFNKILSLFNYKAIVYVHNLKYDFQFIKKEIPFDKVFAKAKRDILFCTCRQIEFRDSLVLAGGASLAFVGKHLRNQTYQKAVGNLDYELIRTPITPLTEEEFYYCEMDIRVLNQYIREKIEDEGTIIKIPYTNTGYVRRYVKEKCFEHREDYLHLIDGLTMTPDCYATCERAFMGGAVGCNIKLTGKLVKNVISYDIKSSYPYVMVAEYFPMSYGHPVHNKDAKDVLASNKYCCIFTLEIFSLVPRQGNDYCFPISESKCREVIGAVTGSGRIMSALHLITECTELDFATYCEFYDLSARADNVIISNLRYFKRGYLPKPIVCSVLEFFNRKTTLDGVKGKEAEYMISKNMLNSIYGMMVEKPVRPEFEFLDGIVEKYAADYVEQVEHYNNKWDRFLFYPWGIYVTAHARRRLYQAIHEVGNDFVYCDTDSVKFVNMSAHADYFEKVNKQAHEKMQLVSARADKPIDYIIPQAPNGERKCLGVWEKEFVATKFKSLGAKRYIYELPNGERKITVAGSNKAGTLEYLETFEDPFEAFNENLIVPKEYAKRIVASFIENEVNGRVTDYLGNEYRYQQQTGIHMKPSSYSFSITEQTKQLVSLLLEDGQLDSGEIE